jgi:hypothetical protein
MKGICGNIRGIIQVKTTAPNAIGEQVETWADVQTLKGWLDLSGGEARYNAYHAKIHDSSHVFICDYVALDKRITNENSRMVINGKRYDVKLIDNPMELNAQLEIFLKYTGGQ